MTHTRYGRSHVHPIGQLTNIRRSDGAPEPDGALKVVARKKIIHYRQQYIDRPEPIAFMPVAVDTSGRIYDDFLRLIFLHAHRETSVLNDNIPEESVTPYRLICHLGLLYLYHASFVLRLFLLFIVLA